MVHLTENDLRLQEYLDGNLPAPERSAIDQHLTCCSECASLVRQYQRLDRELARIIRRPSLSPGFHSRILEQVQTEPISAHTPSSAQQRQQLEQELEAEWRAQQRSFFRAQLPSLLDGLGYSAAAAIGGSLLFRVIMLLVQASGTASAAQANYQALGLAAAAGALILLGALAFVAKTHLSRWLAYF